MISRRNFAAAGAACAGLSLLAGCATPAERHSLPPEGAGRPGAFDADLALVNRVSWGVDSACVADAARLSPAGWLRAQLHPGPDETALPADVQARVDALGSPRRGMVEAAVAIEQQRRDGDALPNIEARQEARRNYQQALTAQARDAAAQFLFRALYSRNQLQEQLAWFWFNHFNVHQYKRDLRALVGDYQATLRVRALGRFEDLLIASATHVAMIRYLDNEQNAVNRINENFAREVMELHTLGVDGGYTQKDVQELARVLTGLGVNFGEKTPALRPALQPLYGRRGATEFNPARHDMGTKQVLGASVAGRGWDEITDELIRLARHPATARHVSRQLALCFASDRPDPALVDRMSRAFTASVGDIAVTLGAMFEAPEFEAGLGRKFKDPVHYVVSAVRLAYDGRSVLDTAPMQGWINRLGEGLYNRQTPDGYPLDAASWSSSGQMSARFEIARTIGSGSAGLFHIDGPPPVDVPAFPQLSNALFHQRIGASLGPQTRAGLDAASSAPEWNTLLLSAPEFMFR